MKEKEELKEKNSR